MSTKKTKWFTFGQCHAHRCDGFTFDKDVVVEITSECPRTTMHDMFGTKWGFEYDSCPNMEYFPRGIRKIER